MLETIENKIKRAIQFKDVIKNINHSDLSYYSLTFYIGLDNKFQNIKIESLNLEVCCIFTNEEQAQEYLKIHNNPKLKVHAAMLGRVIEQVRSEDTIKVLGINPDKDSVFDNILFIPFSDKLTKQNLLSPSDEAISLLSIDKAAHFNMGAETVFFSLTNKHIPEQGEQRVKTLENLVEDLAFVLPRIALQKGSFNIICLILNLENYLEEKAFIREYKTFDAYTDTLFVTSELKLLNGSLEEIPYDGSHLEGIYRPIYDNHKVKFS